MAHITRSRAVACAADLVKAERWETNGSDWYLHDFDVMNPQAMRAAVEAQRTKWRAWQQDHRSP
jgi:hypothetical protein